MDLTNLTQSKFALLPRMIVAVVLMLGLLSGAVPFSSATAEHLCAMECCAGLAPHAAGSCHMDMSSPSKVAAVSPTEHGSDKICGLPEADISATNGFVAGVMGMKDEAASSLDLDEVTIDANDHCSTDSQSKAATSHGEVFQPATIATQSFSKPCPPDCSTGALSSGLRISRQSVVVPHNAQPRPPTLSRKRQHSNRNHLVISTYCKQLRPRGPPSLKSS